MQNGHPIFARRPRPLFPPSGRSTLRPEGQLWRPDRERVGSGRARSTSASNQHRQTNSDVSYSFVSLSNSVYFIILFELDNNSLIFCLFFLIATKHGSECVAGFWQPCPNAPPLFTGLRYMAQTGAGENNKYTLMSRSQYTQSATYKGVVVVVVMHKLSSRRVLILPQDSCHQSHPQF